MCGVVIKILKEEEKKTERNKERNQLRPLQNTGKEIAVFLSDWLIRYC